MSVGTAVGVKDYDKFDPGLRKHNPTQCDTYTPSKLGYLTSNIVPLVDELPRDASILEIGPGTGALMHLLTLKGFRNVRGFEVCEQYATELCARDYHVQHGDSAISYLTAHHELFEAIILVDVLEHLERAEGYALVQACQTRLKAHGRLILQLPNASGLFAANTCYGDFTHRTNYNEHSLRTMLQAAGFSERIHILPLRLPGGPANVVRSALRECVFACLRLLTRVVGANPVCILTANMVAVAECP